MPATTPPSRPNALTRALLAWVLLAALAPVPGQTPVGPQFRIPRAPGAPGDGAIRQATALAVGDVNGDRHPDLVVVQDRAGCQLWMGDPLGRFAPAAPAALPDTARRGTAALLFDFDGDRDLDLLIGYGLDSTRSGRDRLLRNDGSGRFVDITATAMPDVEWSTRCLVAGDLDGDGDLDVVVGCGDQGSGAGARNHVLRNTGTKLVEVTQALPRAHHLTNGLALGDVDDDGDADLVIANGDFTTDGGVADQLLLNDGTGKFVAAPAAAWPSTARVSNAIALVDVDRDRDLDVWIAQGGQRVGARNTLLLNDGDGEFSVAPTNSIPTGARRSTSLAVYDADSDGDPDVVFGNHQEPGRVYTNERGVFTAVGTLPDDPRATVAVAALDVDSDFLSDVVFLDVDDLRVFFGRTRGELFDPRETGLLPLGRRAVRFAKWADIDRDGDLDAIVATDQRDVHEPLEILLNDGFGRLVRKTRELMPTSFEASIRALRIVDFDGDRAPDVLLGCEGPDRLLLNNGTGRLTEAAAFPGGGGTTVALVTGDLDGDGDVDLLTAEDLPSGSQVYRTENRGNGTFRRAISGLPAARGRVSTLVLGDVDGDDKLDLVLGEGRVGRPERNELWLGDGNGDMSRSTTGLGSVRGHTLSATLIDLDGDGDLDLLCADATPGTLHWMENRGRGRFVDVSQRIVGTGLHAVSITAGDVDLDGNTDLVLGSPGNAPPVLLLGNTRGELVASPERMSEALTTAGTVHLGDVDGDGDLDLLQGGSQPRILLNHHRHAWVTTTARAGFDWEARFSAAPGYASTAPTVVLPILSLERLASPIPVDYGDLWPDLSMGLLLPQVPMQGGETSLRFVLPSLLPPLAGQTLNLQGLVMVGTNRDRWHLTNLARSFVLH